MQIFGRKIDLSLTSARAAEQNLYDPALLQMHIRALRTTDYGAAGLIRADIRDNRVKYILTIDGSEHLNIEDAVASLSTTGFTTYTRIAQDITEGTIDQRGTGGLRERLLQMQRSLQSNPAIAERFGITPDEISGIKFVTGTVSAESSQETENVLKRLQNAIVVPDEKEANVMQILVGSGTAQRELSREQILGILRATSDGAGGLLATEELISQLEKGKLGSFLSKTGKRVRGAIGLKGLSLSGEELTSSLVLAGIRSDITGIKTLDETTIRVFDPENELFETAKQFVSKLKEVEKDQSIDLQKIVTEMFDFFGDKSEERAFYRQSGAEGLITSALQYTGILKEEKGKLLIDEELFNIVFDESFILSDEQKALKKTIVGSLKKQFAEGFDGASLINKKYIESIKKQFIEERNQLLKSDNINEYATTRIKELNSYIETLNSTDFEAITGRIFFTEEGKPRLLKTVLGLGRFNDELEKYAILTTKESVKRETGIMAQANTLNLTLQSEPSGRFYYDPLAPAFHYDIFDEDIINATRVKHRKVLEELTSAIDTGIISPRLKQQITAAANEDVFSPHITQAQREIAKRNRLFMRQLKDALDSGVDIRSLPNLMNYLVTFASADLYRFKDGIYQPALEGVFRFAINNETVFRSGNIDAPASTLGQGFEEIFFGIKDSSGKIIDKKSLQAVKFEVQGHSLLFGGNATHIFKQSLGGFDLDDHGIIIPRIFYDASGDKRLGHFIYRQPTGHGEFIFGRSSFRSANTVAAIFGQEEMYREAMDSLVSKGVIDADNIAYQALNVQKLNKKEIKELNYKFFKLSKDEQYDQVEKVLIKMLEEAGVAKEVDLNTGIFAGMKDYASPIALDSIEKTKALVDAGVIEEAAAAKLYTKGQVLRIFLEQDAFKISDDFHSKIKTIIKGTDLAELEKLKKDSVRYQAKLGSIMRGLNLEDLDAITGLVELEYQQLSDQSIALRGSIGKYTNRYTIATSGGDQTSAILSELEQKGQKEFVDEFTKKYMYAFGPSDVVDVLTNLSSSTPNAKIIGAQATAEETERLIAIYSSNISDPNQLIAMQKALRKIMNKKLGNTEEAVGQQLIEQKAILTAQLRAQAIQNELDEDLIYGIDKQYIKRMSETDAVLFRDKFLEEYQKQVEKFGSSVNQKLAEELQNFQKAISEGSDKEEVQESIARMIGLHEKNKFARATQFANLGLESKRSLDVAAKMFAQKSYTSYLSEVNINSEASTIAENILNSYKKFVDENTQAFAYMNPEELNDLIRLQNSIKRSQIADQVLASIYTEAEQSKSATVQDIVDNIQRMLDSRYRRYSSIMTINNGVFEENELRSLFYFTERSREEKFLKRQGIEQESIRLIRELRDKAKSGTELEKIRLIEQSQVELLSSTDKQIRTVNASFIAEFDQLGGEKFIRDVLSEDELRLAQAMRRYEYAQRVLDEELISETNIRDILVFGNQKKTSRGIQNALELSRVINDLGEDRPISSQVPTFKRISEAFKDGSLRNLFQQPNIKNSVFAMGALIGGSIIYRATKDRGESEITGPPLLPGGSAYETMPQRAPQIPNVSMFSGYNPGESYNVNIEAGRDQIESFRSSLGSVARGPVNSTMYRGLPQLGKNPYQEVASNY